MSDHIREFYTNPMDVVQFLDGDKAEKLMQYVLSKAYMFHEDSGLSAVVKAEKHDMYLVDYFFLVQALSEHVFGLFEKNNPKIALAMKEQIIVDFGKDGEFKAKQLLVDLLDYKGVLYSNSDKRWLYTIKRYRGKFNEKRFVISGVIIDGNFIKNSLDDAMKLRLEKFGDCRQFELEEIGRKALQFQQTVPDSRSVFSFC